MEYGLREGFLFSRVLFKYCLCEISFTTIFSIVHLEYSFSNLENVRYTSFFLETKNE